MKRFHDRRGFTLIELMVVVVIGGIVIAIAMPAITSYRRKEDTRSAAQAVSGMVSDARSQAIASGRMTFLLLAEPTNGALSRSRRARSPRSSRTRTATTPCPRSTPPRRSTFRSA